MFLNILALVLVLLLFLAAIVSWILLIFDSFAVLFDGSMEWIAKIITLMIFTVVTLLSTWGCSSFIDYTNKWSNYPTSQMNYVQDWKYDLVALKDSQNIKGQFSGSLFVSRGYINTDLYYYYVINTEKGKVSQKLASSISYLDDTKTNVQPTVLCGHYVFKDHDFWRDEFWPIGHKNSDECYLVVPKGTVTGDFNIDLQ